MYKLYSKLLIKLYSFQIDKDSWRVVAIFSVVLCCHFQPVSDQEVALQVI